jgi:sec-independent protein translocase protein TatC
MATPSSEEEAELESSKAPLLEHLVELRSRLVKSLIAFLVAFIISFFFAKNIYRFLVQPLADAFAKRGPPGRHLIFTALYRPSLTVKVGVFGAICLAFPTWRRRSGFRARALRKGARPSCHSCWRRRRCS